MTASSLVLVMVLPPLIVVFLCWIASLIQDVKNSSESLRRFDDDRNAQW